MVYQFTSTWMRIVTMVSYMKLLAIVDQNLSQSFGNIYWRQLLKISCKLPMSYHIQSDGQTKRTNKMIEQYLYFSIKILHLHWVEFLYLWNFLTIMYSTLLLDTTPSSQTHVVLLIRLCFKYSKISHMCVYCNVMWSPPCHATNLILNVLDNSL